MNPAYGNPTAAPWTTAHQRAWDEIRLELETVVKHAQRFLGTREGAEPVVVALPDGRSGTESRAVVTLWEEPYEAVNAIRGRRGLPPVDRFRVRQVEASALGADYWRKYAMRLADLAVDGDPRFVPAVDTSPKD